jgi:hypothetical protein
MKQIFFVIYLETFQHVNNVPIYYLYKLLKTRKEDVPLIPFLYTQLCVDKMGLLKYIIMHIKN